jgi:hypothetical protein
LCTPGLSLCYGQLMSAQNQTVLASATSKSATSKSASLTMTTTTTTTAGPIYYQCICKKSTLARSPGV